MRNLIQFFVKYRVVFLFILLEAISFLFIFQFNNFHRVKFLNSSNRITGTILNQYNSSVEFLSLRKVNDDLAEENARLLIENKIMAEQLAAFEIDSQFVNVDTLSQILSAKVINNSTNKYNNSITINKGRKDGVVPDMGLICPEGIVGVVINASDHFSTALSVLNSRWSINAKLLNTNYFGSLRWEGNNPRIATLFEIPFHVKVNYGDTIITSGYSSIFPEGLMIGVVSEIEEVKGDNFQKLKVELSTNFSNLTYVNIVGDLLKEELKNLENETVNE